MRRSNCRRGAREAGTSGIQGGALIITIMGMAILFIIAGTLLSVTTSKQSAPFQAASWHEAGAAAEGGVEIALNALRRSLVEGESGWDGWDKLLEPSLFQTGYETPFAKKFITPAELMSHEGEGNTNVRAMVEVTVPTGSDTINKGINSNESYKWAYLVRSTGTADVPGPTRIAVNKSELALRKVSFLTDFRSKAKVSKPQINRVIQAIITPVFPFPLAIQVREQLDIKSGKNMVVDSYDPAIGKYEVSASPDLRQHRDERQQEGNHPP